MKRIHLIQLAIGLLMMPTALSARIGDAFTYQGSLEDAGAPVANLFVSGAAAGGLYGEND